MPDKRRHRGPHPEDRRWFAPETWSDLREAVGDLSWLLTRGYGEKSALKLVGDRFDLTQRQRLAVIRSACSDEALRLRRAREISPENAADRHLLIDGYNVLTTIEAALADGVLILGRDGCLRDMASMHGSYRKVAETGPALALIGEVLEELALASCGWFLDQPVSNSGRLKAIMLELARQKQWNWAVELVPDPDAVLAATHHPIATADSAVLDRCERWFNLARYVVRSRLDDRGVIALGERAG